MTTQIPTLKLESVPDDHVKMEVVDDSPSPYMDDIDEAIEDAGDLDFTQAQQNFWLSHLPRSLWESLSQLNDNDEITLGTIRIEGHDGQGRVSMMLNRDLPQFKLHPKEYILAPTPSERRRSKKPGQALLFSEQDLPGYKSKQFAWDEIDEEGNPGQGRSFLYEKHKRELRKKENKGRFVPYSKRTISKKTAIHGAIEREFETIPVRNDEYYSIEAQQSTAMLKPQQKVGTIWTKEDPSRMQYTMLTMAERANINKASQARKQAAKDSRNARMEKPELIDKLLELFRQHRIWGLRDLKARVNQPESYLREVLDEIAFMWKQGDFNGKWELKNEYKQQDSAFLNPTGGDMVAKTEDSDMEKSGMDDDDDDDDAFEDV